MRFTYSPRQQAFLRELSQSTMLTVVLSVPFAMLCGALSAMLSVFEGGEQVGMVLGLAPMFLLSLAFEDMGGPLYILVFLILEFSYLLMLIWVARAAARRFKSKK